MERGLVQEIFTFLPSFNWDSGGVFNVTLVKPPNLNSPNENIKNVGSQFF